MMALKSIDIEPCTLRFKQPAGTSRGVYHDRNLWYVKVRDENGRVGVGECAPLPQLSCDDVADYEEILRSACDALVLSGEIDYEAMRPYPSMLFGLETALLNLRAGGFRLFDTPFSRGEEGITINGLVWMGSYEEMKARLEEKLSAGFHCIKLKIGAIDFENEMALIERIRGEFSRDDVELRVDANGAFAPSEAMKCLERLARYDIHSIEQPIRAGQWEEMARLCRHTPLPIALDEELIGVNCAEEKRRLLDTIKPQYIILKPSLHGGLRGSDEWISLAEQRGIGWWATSALESNVGLNAIAQWVSTHSPTMPQGLGTGQLFTENVTCPLELMGDCMRFNPLRDE